MKYTIILLLLSCALWGQDDTNSPTLIHIKDTVKSYYIGERGHYEAEDYYWYHKGWDAERHDKYKKAIEYYTKAIELNPKYADAYFERGFNKLQLKKYNEAIVDYTKAIELYPNDRFYLSRGCANYELKNMMRQ